MEIKTTLEITQQQNMKGYWVPTLKLCKIIEDVPVSSLSSDAFKNLKEYTPQKGDKLFFLPGCTVPRFKMKKFCEEHGTAMVKYKEKANALFIGKDTLNEIARYNLRYAVDTVDFKNYIDKHGSPEAQELVNQVTSKKIYTIYHALAEVIRTASFSLTSIKPTFESHYVGDKSSVFRTDDAYETFINYRNASNVYHENNVLRLVNSGKPMNAEQYESIKRFFESSDDSNVKVAMDIMANCDYEKSSVYLLLLIYQFGYTISNTPTVKHVNFQSLLKFFNIKNIGYVNMDEVIEALVAKQLLNQANLDALMPHVEKIFNASMQQLRVSYFKCTEFSYTEAIEQALKENILDSTQDTTILPELEEQLNPHV